MSATLEVLVCAFVAGVLSLAGGVMLLLSRRVADVAARPLSAFAAGVLLATALLDLIPEAVARGDAMVVARAALLGFLAFLLAETVAHHRHGDRRTEMPPVALLVAGDTVHNFVDGVIIAGSFFADARLGLASSLAVAAHEVPQEIGDFALMLRAGMARRRVLLINFVSALATIAGAAAALAFGDQIRATLPVILGATAGLFLYISACNLIPQIRRVSEGAWRDVFLLVAGAGVVAVVTR